MLDYGTKCNELLTSLQSQLIGWGPPFRITRSHENTSGIPIEIHRCPCCWAYGDNRNANSSDVEHDAKCTLKSLLSMWTWT